MEKQILEALRKQLRPLTTAADNGQFDDLAFLADVLRDVRIVGLGEGRHGTREHFQFKHRIIRFLVEKVGFRVFVIESALDACDVVNEYILYGRGDMYRALAGLHFWTWDTEEVAALIEWMREHNQTCQAGEECFFLGFDIQSCDVACERLLKRLVPLAGSDTERVRRCIEACARVNRKTSPDELPDAAWLLGWVSANQVALTRASSPQDYQLFVRYARHIFQCISHFSHGSSNDSRDRLMAENVSLLLNELPSGSKLILWAHNGHIAARFEWKTIGHWLREAYGSLYYALGFTLCRGQFQSRLYDREAGTIGPLRAFDVPPIGDNLWEYDLSQLATGNFMIDLRTAIASSPDIARWAASQKDFLMLDEAWDPAHGQYHYEIPGVLSQTFDGILYTEETSRARPNPTGLRE